MRVCALVNIINALNTCQMLDGVERFRGIVIYFYGILANFKVRCNFLLCSAIIVTILIMKYGTKANIDRHYAEISSIIVHTLHYSGNK